MKAWLIDSFTGLHSLRIAEAPDPIASLGQVVLNLQYAALNPADRYLSQGEYPAKPPLPHILGRDGLGIVAAVGERVTGIEVGQKMILLRGEAGVNKPGTFAAKVAAPAEYLEPVPQGWSDAEAAGAALVYETAYQALTMWPDFSSPGVVLITGASGGVGVAALQLAKAMGHAVITLSRDAGKQEQLRRMGADFCISPAEPAWRKSSRDALNGRRVDLAIDNIGGSLLAEVIETLGQNGRVSCVGRLAGPVPEFNTASLFFRRLRIGGVAVSTYTNPQARAAWEEIVNLMNRKSFKPVVDSVYPFDKLPDAFARLAHGPMGKVILAAGCVTLSAGQL